VRRGVLALLAVLACGHDRSPTVRSNPKPDGRPALRGGGAPRSPRIANYKLDARLDPERHVVTGNETLTWTNTGTTAVDRLPFHLYMNAFKNEQSLFMRESHGDMRSAHASDNGWGWIQLDSVTVGGVERLGALARPGSPDETVVELPLAEPLPPCTDANDKKACTITVGFKFTVQLPEVWARTGYKGEFHMIGQWFPKIGVRVGAPGDERWECKPFHANAEFFADFGTYDVTLTVPSTYVVAATGVLVQSQDLAGGARSFTYRAEDVHDFVWMADPYMQVMSGTAAVDGDSVDVRVYYRPEQEAFAERHKQAAIGAIEQFSKLFVAYPWPIMTVIDPPVDAARGAGGMEYPTLVTTEGDGWYSRPGVRIPEFVTVHEIGHNWFQGLLASNEVEEAWMDEGVNEWADGHVMAELYGARTSAIDWAGWTAEAFALRRAIADDPSSLPSPIASAAYAFVDNENYGEATYTSTMRALRTLELTVGSQKMMAAMKAYARAWAWKHPTGRDLFRALEEQLGQDLTWFFGPVFHEVGGVELAVRSVKCLPVREPRGVFGEGSNRRTVGEEKAPDTSTWRCELVVQSTGTIHLPVDIELRFADGSSERLRWDDRDRATWQRFVVDRSAKVVEVRLDPDDKIQLDAPVTHAYRVEGEGAASLRAAARVAWWTQSLMELVGP
jgi:hypothetical protein